MEKSKDCEFNYHNQSKNFLKDENSISKSKKHITGKIVATYITDKKNYREQFQKLRRKGVIFILFFCLF